MFSGMATCLLSKWTQTPQCSPQIHVVQGDPPCHGRSHRETMRGHTASRRHALPHLRRVCEACACARCDPPAWRCTRPGAPSTWRRRAPPASRRPPPLAGHRRPPVHRTRKRTRAAPTTTTTTMITRRLGPSAPPRLHGRVHPRAAGRRERRRGVAVQAGASAEDGDVVSRRPAHGMRGRRRPSIPTARRRHKSALDGAGQVIGTIDTGVALACYFRDAPRRPLLRLRGGSGRRAPPHRRGVPAGAPQGGPVRAQRRWYILRVRGRRRPGRPRVTAGTLAGAAWCAPRTCTARMDAMRGVAHAAQLAVYDAGPTPTVTCCCRATCVMRSRGHSAPALKVHSNSMGLRTPAASTTCSRSTSTAHAPPTPSSWWWWRPATSTRRPTRRRTSPRPVWPKNALTVGATYAAAEPRESLLRRRRRVLTQCGRVRRHIHTRRHTCVVFALRRRRSITRQTGSGGARQCRVVGAQRRRMCAGRRRRLAVRDGAAVVPLQGTSMATRRWPAPPPSCGSTLARACTDAARRQCIARLAGRAVGTRHRHPHPLHRI